MKTLFKNIYNFALIATLVTFSFVSCEDSENSSTINSYSGVTIGNQYNPIGMYVNLYTGKVYTPQQAFEKQSEIHFAHYYLKYSSISEMVTSPSEINDFFDWGQTDKGGDFYYNSVNGFKKWTVINKSEIMTRSITEGEFANISNGNQLMEAFGNPYLGLESVLGITVGNVYKFITPEGKRGLFLVKRLTGDKNTSGELVIDIKVMK